MISRNILAASFLFAALTAAGASLEFSGSRVIAVDVEASTGLEKIYVVENLSTASASFSTSANWSLWGSAGAAYAEQVATSSSTYTFASNDDTGVTIESGGRQYHFWVVDYSQHHAEFSAIEPDNNNSDCSTLSLTVSPLSGDINYGIYYYNINGARRTLDRGYTLSYNTLEWDEGNKTYQQATISENIEALKPSLQVIKPLCDTSFTLSGDKFAREWGYEFSVTGSFYTTDAVAAETWATQTERDNDNEQKDTASSLGGSAPVEITFTAVTTDAVKFTEWQMSSSPEFEDFELRFNQEEVTYTFRDYGTWYMRFQASNNDGTCDWFSPTYEISIGESKLECPNAFSPANQDGVNDLWKVSYKSIIEFECHIFNRWGNKMATLSDPSQGWDGKHNGKFVPSGTYYYVIKAKGSDGHSYDLSGDINIIGFSQKTTTVGAPDTAQ